MEYGLLSPELEALMARMGASEQDRKDANKQAAFAAGFSLLGTPKGMGMQALGNAGLNAMGARQSYLAGIPQQKMAAFGAASKFMDMNEQMRAAQEQRAQQEQMRTLTQSSMIPGLPQMGPPTASGQMQPEVLPSFDKQKFGTGLWGIDPGKAMAFEQAQAKESPFAKIDPAKYTQESVARFVRSGNPGDLKSSEADTVGKLNPSDFTPASVAAYSRSGNYADLVPIDKRAVTNVSVKNVGESEYDKTLGKSNAEQYVQYQTAGRNADATIGRLDAIDKMLRGVDTSGLTPIGMQVSSAAKGLGIDIDPKLPAKQAAAALANEMALQSRQGGQMPGAMSDKDREFLQAMNPNLSQTPEGRALLIDTRKKVAQREKEVAGLARQYAAKNGGRLDSGFDAALASYADAHPLFPKTADAAPAAPTKIIKYDAQGRRIQ